MRYLFKIEYDGTEFCGWQKQKHAVSIQECLSNAAFQLTQEKVTFHGAGRTDSGVHALEQIAHVNFQQKYDLKRLKFGMNFYLRPKLIIIRDVQETYLHARFDAVKKLYRYNIWNADVCSVFEKRYVWHLARFLNIEKMQTELKCLVGTNDFSSFRDSQCSANSTVRTLYSVSVTRVQEKIMIEFMGRAFLHSSIRIMVGTVVDVALGRLKTSLKEILHKKDRKYAGITAPASGLFLCKVMYK